MQQTFANEMGSVTISGGDHMAPAGQVRITGKVGLFLSKSILIPVSQAQEMATALLSAAHVSHQLDCATCVHRTCPKTLTECVNGCSDRRPA